MELKTINEFLTSDLMNEFKAVHNTAYKGLELLVNEAATVQTMTNLKLYDVASNFELDHKFELFCDDEYQLFSEFLKDKGLDTLQVGRTSSFYIVPARYTDTFDDMDYSYIYGTPNSMEFNDAIEYVSWRYKCLKDYHDTDVEYIIEALEDELTIEIDELEYFLTYTIFEIEDDVTAVSEGYEYIDRFKKHQVAIYNDFLNYESDIFNIESELG